MERLRKRREFLKVQKGGRPIPAFFPCRRCRATTAAIRGSASRIKRGQPLGREAQPHRRRLKEAMRGFRPPMRRDFVIVAKIESLSRPSPD